MKKIQLFLLQGLLSSVPLYTLTAQTTTPSTHYAVETGIVAGARYFERGRDPGRSDMAITVHFGLQPIGRVYPL